MPISTMKASIAAAALGLCTAAASPAHAQTAPAPALPTSFIVISPIYDQLVRFSMPSNFVTAYENTNGPSYIREAVLRGETVQQWTQMITVTGAKGLAAKVTPQQFAGALAGGFQKACPDTFDAKGLGATKFGDQEAFVAVVGCGRDNSSADKHGETALLIAVKGSADIYSLQWAERSAGADKPALADPKWQERLSKLNPIRFCPIVPGEKAPYPSCVDKK